MSTEVANAEYGRYERRHGMLCDRDRTVKEDAALIRKTITEWRKAGIVPADVKTSVRYRTFAGGCSIDIEVTIPWQSTMPLTRRQQCQGSRNAYEELDDSSKWFVPSPAVADAFVAIKDLHSSLNFDGSEIQTDYFDVKFYGQVTIETTAGWQGGHLLGASCWTHTEGFVS